MLVPNPPSSIVALYLRVSTEEQDLDGQDRDLRLYAEGRGWEIGARFTEKTPASGKVERTAYEELRRAAADPERKWSRVLVWSLDRWSRDPSFVRAVGSIEELEARGIRFHSFKEPALDTGEDGAPNLARDILRGILPSIATFESRRRSDRTQLAMNEIKAGRRPTRTGRPPGRPVRVTPGKLAEIQQRRKRGEAWADIARHVGLPRETCRRAVRRPNSRDRGGHNPERAQGSG